MEKQVGKVKQSLAISCHTICAVVAQLSAGAEAPARLQPATFVLVWKGAGLVLARMNIRLFVLCLLTCSLAPLGATEEANLLLGNWVRPDGGYVMKVLSVAKDGTAKVEYYNPSPIPVSEAKAGKDESGALTLEVKFARANYAGSQYTLVLKEGRLVGKYYQAMMQQTYEVFFERPE